jgi:hypothetical protein
MSYPFYQEVIFTDEECKKIIEYSKVYPANAEKRKLEPNINLETNRAEQNIPSIDGKKKGKAFFVYDIDREENTEWVFQKLLNWFQKVSNIKLKETPTLNGMTLLNYKVGDFFMRHTDIYPNFEWRRWTINIQLGDQYKGGDYVLYLDEKEIVLNKEVGNAIAYWAGTEHEVKEIKEGERWSIVCSVGKHLIIENEKKLL